MKKWNWFLSHTATEINNTLPPVMISLDDIKTSFFYWPVKAQTSGNFWYDLIRLVPDE